MNIIKPNLKFTGPLKSLQRVEKLVQHHMAHPTWDIHDVHRYHQSKGWIGIGYNYWIAFDGTIYEGRGLHVGAHVEGWNNRTIGIGYQGDFTWQKMTNAQLQSGIELNRWLMQKFGLTANDVAGHRDLAATTCPGPNFRMDELRKEMAGMAGVTQPNVWTGQPLRKGDKGLAVRDLQVMLQSAGFNPGQPDGIFGQQTEQAVRAAQKAFALAVDGVAGPKTFQALRDALAKPKGATNSKPVRLMSGTFPNRESALLAKERLEKEFPYNFYVVDA